MALLQPNAFKENGIGREAREIPLFQWLFCQLRWSITFLPAFRKPIACQSERLLIHSNLIEGSIQVINEAHIYIAIRGIVHVLARFYPGFLGIQKNA